MKPLKGNQQLRSVSLSYSVMLQALNQNPLHEGEGAWMQAPIEVSRRGVGEVFLLDILSHRMSVSACSIRGDVKNILLPPPETRLATVTETISTYCKILLSPRPSVIWDVVKNSTRFRVLRGVLNHEIRGCSRHVNTNFIIGNDTCHRTTRAERSRRSQARGQRSPTRTRTASSIARQRSCTRA